MLGIVNIPSKEVKLINLGNFWARVLLTVMVTAEVVKLFPALSSAVAVKVWLPLVRVVVSRGWDRVAVEEVAKTEPSIDRLKDFRPEVTWPATVGSFAAAEAVMVPLTVPGLGLVMAAVGAVVSGARLTTTVTLAVTGPEALVAVKV